MQKILVARPIFPEVVERLKAHFEVDWNDGPALAPDELVRRLADKDGALTAGDMIDAAVLAGKHVTTPALYTASGHSPEIHLRCARLYAQKKWGEVGSPTWSLPPYRHEKIRVAYISADFREHPVAYLMAGVFERHDRTRFEVTGVSLIPPDTSSLGERVRRAFHDALGDI